MAKLVYQDLVTAMLSGAIAGLFSITLLFGLVGFAIGRCLFDRFMDYTDISNT